MTWFQTWAPVLTFLGGLLSTVIGVVVYAVRLEGKLKTHEAKDETMFEQLQKRQDERHEENVSRLERIERKLDSLPTRISNGNTGQYKVDR